MDNLTTTTIDSSEEKGFSFQNYLLSCLEHWKWFVISLIVCMGLGVYYYMRQQPVYARDMLLLIQDDGAATGGMDMSSAFKSFGFGGPSTNVYNEMVSLQSPAVMFEVVKRLELYVNANQKGFPHETTLYKASCPFDFNWEDREPTSNAKFLIELNPDDTFLLKDFSYVPKGAKDRVKFKDEVKGKIGFGTVVTPVGNFQFLPNGLYTNNREKSIDIEMNITSDKTAVEIYTTKVSADLENIDADVIELAMTDVNVSRAEDVLQNIVDVYNEFWVRDKNRMAVATADFIDERLRSLIKELNQVDGEIADYQQDHQLIDLAENAKQTLEQSSSLNRNYLEVSNQLAMAKYIRDYISNPSNVNAVVPVNTGTGSGALEQQIAQYNTLVLTMENLRSNSSANNPIVKDYERQTKGLRESLIKSVSTQIGALEANLRNIDSALDSSKSQISSAPKEAQHLGSIKRDQAVKESLYLFLLEKREENSLTQAFNAYNTRIINPPYGPSKPIAPSKGMTLVMAFMLGFIIPAVWLYIKMMLDNKVHSRADLEDLPIPFTGEIPQVGKKSFIKNLFTSKKKKQEIIDTPKPIVEAGKRDVPNEAFRVVRSNIDLMLGRNHKHSVLMLTSFNPGSGKSFICYNLGAAFALKNKKVLLIDGDLRHGSLSTYVGSPGRGLASYLTGTTTDPSKIAYKVPGFEDLSILPIGKRPPNPAELLEGDRFGKLLDEVKEQYDVVLVDCPPVNVVVDTQLINHYGDGTLFVVRAGLLERSAVKDLVNLYNEHKLKRMSIILNGTEETHSSYYTYGNYQSLEE